MQNQEARYEYIINNIKPRDFSIYKKKDYLIKQYLSNDISFSKYNIEFPKLIGEIDGIFKLFLQNLTLVNELSIKENDSIYEFIMQYIYRFIQVRKNEASSYFKHNTLNDKIVEEVLNLNRKERINKTDAKQLVFINEKNKENHS